MEQMDKHTISLVTLEGEPTSLFYLLSLLYAIVENEILTMKTIPW